MKFKLGDRVIRTKTNETGTIVTLNGELCKYNPNCHLWMGDYEVKLDGYNHDACDDVGYLGYALCNENELKLEESVKMNRFFEVVRDDMRKHPEAEIQLPLRGSKYAIAYDVFSPIDITIKPFENGMIWTDVKAFFGRDEALLCNVRSSMGKQPIMLANSQGWIESDYYGNMSNDGNIGFNLFNLGKTDYVIKKGDRIGQVMFIKYLASDNGNSEDIRTGGFGSTNK